MDPESISSRLKNIVVCCRILQEDIEKKPGYYKHIIVDIDTIKRKALDLMICVQNDGVFDPYEYYKLVNETWFGKR